MADPHAAIGPSHFMKPNLNDEWVQLIWDHSILPYVAEHFFGEEERLEQFRLDVLSQDASGAEQIVDNDASANAD
jgi:5-methylcytosine-specific restriction enzyme B